MKRTACLAVALLLIMSTFTSCIVIPLYKNFEIDAATVSSIEIYDLCNTDTFCGCFLETESPVYTISSEKESDFLNDLSAIEFSDAIIIVLAAIDPSFYYDTWTVRINYTDGSYELISCDGFGEIYDQNGEAVEAHHFGCDNEEWSAFIAKYLPEDVFLHQHGEEI